MKISSVDPGNQVEKTQRKWYDNHEDDDVQRLDVSSVSTDLARRHETLRERKEKTNSGNSVFQCRYIVTLFGFCTYFELDCYRIATSMSVVKMVNSTAINIQKHLNNTIDSCPINNSSFDELPNPYVGGEFDWSPEIQSYILSAGFLGYVISQIPAGLFAETYGAKKVLLNGVLISSLSHILCPVAAWYNCNLLIAMQLLRGVGQGFLSPANSVITAKWFPKPERGFLNSLIFTGYGVGSLITYLASGVLCSSTLLNGWPLVYFVFGGLGLVFGLCVHIFLYESPKEHPTMSKAELIYILENQECDWSQKKLPTPWRKILTSVPVYVMTYSIFSHFWVSAQQLTAHPIFLDKILHFSIKTNGMLNALPFAFQILLVFLGGWISKWLNTHGYVGVDKVRKGCTMLYCLGYSLALLGMYYAGCNRVLSNVSSIIAFSFIGISVPGCVIVPFDMSPTFAGSLFAFSNTIASSATFIFPLIVGAMIDEEESLEQWNKIFLICVIIVMSSGVLFWLFGSAEIQHWNFPSTGIVDGNQIKEGVVESENKEAILSKEISLHI